MTTRLKRVHQGFGQELPRQVAVGELNEADQEQQRGQGIGRPSDPVEHVGREQSRHGGEREPLARRDP